MTDTLCVCGHAAESHTHLRDGRDCSRCGRVLCREFRPLTWWRRVLQRCGWYPAPLPDPVPAVDLTSLFTPAQFQVVPREAAWLAGAEPILSPEQWAAAVKYVDAAGFGSAHRAPPLDADGRRIKVGDWVEILVSPRQTGEVLGAFGLWCAVRVPPRDPFRLEYSARLRVIVEEES